MKKLNFVFDCMASNELCFDWMIIQNVCCENKANKYALDALKYAALYIKQQEMKSIFLLKFKKKMFKRKIVCF